MSEPTTPAPSLTREDWLHRAIDEVRPIFAQLGYEVPAKIHVSVGFGNGGGKYESKNVLGVCWHSAHSEDGANHIFVSPTIGDTTAVVLVLLHELGHAIDNNTHGHRGPFREMMEKLGFEAPFTELHPDVVISGIAMQIAAVLGDYPHSVLSPVRVQVPADVPAGEDGGVITTPRPNSGPPVQTNRWFHFACPDHARPVRMSRGAAAEGAPFCGHRDEQGIPCLKEMQPRG